MNKKQKTIKTPNMNNEQQKKVYKKKSSIRKDILSDIWAANKKVIDGKWYVELAQVCEIIGGNLDINKSI